MLPPNHTRPPPAAAYPASRMCAVRVEVVVFPSLPVTPMTVAGVSSRKSSISESTTAPPARARASSGVSGRSPGERKITGSFSSPR